MTKQFELLFFKYLDSKKDLYKSNKINKRQLESIIRTHKVWFLKEYYLHVIKSNSDSEEFLEDFFSVFPKEVKSKCLK